MDTLRGAAILLVIVNHAAELPTMLIGVQPPTAARVLDIAASPYRMPMLMVLSGLLLARALAKPPSTYYVGKIRTLVWPYAVWVCIYWIVVGVDTVPDWHEWIGTSWLWYIFNLAVYFLIAPLLQRLPMPAVPLLFWAASIIVPEGAWTNFFLYGGYFFAGHLLWTHRDVLRRFQTVPVTLICVGIAVALAAAYVVQDALPDVGFLTKENVVSIPFTLAAIVGLIVVAQAVPDRVTSPLRFLGRNSVVFYLVHFPLQIILSPILWSLGASPWGYVLAGTVLALLVGAVLTLLRRFAIIDAFFVLPVLPVRMRGVSAAGG